MQMASASCGEKLLDVIFKLDFGMHSGPIMRGADEGQEKQSVLETDGAEQPIERVERFGSVGRLQENVAGEGEKSEFHLRVGRRNFGKRRGSGGTVGEYRFKFGAARKRAAQQFHHGFDAFGTGGFIAGRMAESNQETGVAGDAVAHCAETGKMNEKAFFKN